MDVLHQSLNLVSSEIKAKTRGYDPELFDLIEGELEKLDLICSICGMVMNDAVQTNNGNDSDEACGHLFCRPCIESWLNLGKKSCPTCRAHLELEQLHDDISLRRRIRALRVRCSFAPKKCKSTGTLGKDGSWWREHAESCLYAPVKCWLCEKVTSRRKSISKHVRVCPKGIVYCKHGCGAALVRETVKDHERKCRRRPATCPHCQGTGIPWHLLDFHIAEECPETEVPCEFRAVGCRHTFRRGEIAQQEVHNHSNMVQHLQLMMQTMQLLRERLDGKENKEDIAKPMKPENKYWVTVVTGPVSPELIPDYQSEPIHAFGYLWAVYFGYRKKSHDVPCWLKRIARNAEDAGVDDSITIMYKLEVLHPRTGRTIAARPLVNTFSRKKICYGAHAVTTLDKLRECGAYRPDLGIDFLHLRISFHREI